MVHYLVYILIPIVIFGWIYTVFKMFHVNINMSLYLFFSIPLTIGLEVFWWLGSTLAESSM